MPSASDTRPEASPGIFAGGVLAAVLMNLADELLSIAADRELPRIDEKLVLDAFNQPPRAAKNVAAKRR